MPVKTDELSMMVKDNHDDVKQPKTEKHETINSNNNNLAESSPNHPSSNDQKPPIVVHSHPTNINQKEMMNKTVNIGKDNKMNMSLMDQRQIPPQRARGP